MYNDMLAALAATMMLFAVVFAAISFGLAFSLERLKKELKAKEDSEAASTHTRLERIERAVDSIAVEVERIGEVERFGARVLAALPGNAPAPAPEGRVITPH